MSKLRVRTLIDQRQRAVFSRRISPLQASLVIVLCYSLLAVGCGGGSSGNSGNSTSNSAPTPTPTPSASPTPTPSPTPTTLLADDFSGSFPSKNWIIVSGAPVIDAAVGNPAPSLEFPQGTNGFPGADIQSAVNPFSTSGGLTISFDLGCTTNGATMLTFIKNQNGGNPVAELIQGGCNAGQVSYLLDQAVVTQPVNPDNNFHTYSLVIDAAGNATWLRDGIQQFSRSGFSANALVLEFRSNFGLGPTFLDNVKLQVP